MSAIGLGRQAANPGGRTLSGGTADFLGKLVEYIPADIIAGYVAVYALVNGSDAQFREEWITALVFLVLTPFVVITAFVGEFKKQQQRRPSRHELPWFRIFIAPIAYSAWVFALPDTPARDWGDVTGFWQTLVLVATTLVLAGLGAVIDA